MIIVILHNPAVTELQRTHWSRVSGQEELRKWCNHKTDIITLYCDASVDMWSPTYSGVTTCLLILVLTKFSQQSPQWMLSTNNEEGEVAGMTTQTKAWEFVGELKVT